MVRGQNDTNTGVSLQSFLQIIEMDKVTATVSIKEDGQQQGALFFVDGLLVDAEYKDKFGLDAAYILCVQKFVSFSIDPPVERPVRIDVPLSHVLLQASVLQDERQKIRGKEAKPSQPRHLSLQELINFFDKSERVSHYILLNRQGKIIVQSAQVNTGKIRLDKTGNLMEGKVIPFLVSCAFLMVNAAEYGGVSLNKSVFLLEDGRAVISDWYENMVLSVFLASTRDIRKMEVLLDRLSA